MAVNIGKVLEGFGLSEESVDRLKLSRGVVGRTTYVALGLVIVLGIVAWRVPTENLLAIASIAALAFLAYFGGVLWFAHKNPGVALLEGAELLRWKQIEMEVKGKGSVPPTPVTIEPEESKPQLPQGDRS